MFFLTEICSGKYFENIDNFLARCHLQVKKCKFQDEKEMEGKKIEQIIVGMKYFEIQKQLILKDIVWTESSEYMQST